MPLDNLTLWSPNQELLPSAVENTKRRAEDQSLLMNDGKCIRMALGKADRHRFFISGAANVAGID